MRLAAVTCLFGVRDNAQQLANYCRCAANLAARGIDLWTVEACYPWQQSVVTSRQRIAVEIRDYLWHKERLLQIGIRQLPDQYDAVLVLDADLLFELTDIRDRIEQVLSKYVICQPWSDAVYLDESNRPLCGPLDIRKCPSVNLGRWMSEVPQFLRRSAAVVNFNQRTFVRAHPGLAWAARREWFSRVGLYEYSLGGNGDETLAEGCWGVADQTARANYSAAHWADVLLWIALCFNEVRGKVGCVPGNVHHLWHGSVKSRAYRERELTLVEHGFDPRRHVLDTPGQALQWSPEAPELLVSWWQDYLTRPEESNRANC